MTEYQKFKMNRYRPFSIEKIGGTYTFLCETMGATIYEHSSNGTVAIIEKMDIYICAKGNANSIMNFSLSDIKGWK